MAVIRGGWGDGKFFLEMGGCQEWGGEGWFDNGGTLYIVSRRLPPILWRLPPLLPTNFVQPHTPTYLLPPTRLHTVLSVALFLWLNGWSRHIWCAILLNDNMDLLQMSNLGTLNQKDLDVCLMQQGLKFPEVWHIMVFFTCSLIWYHARTYTHTTPHTEHTSHSGDSRMTHPYKYIFTPSVTCSQQLPLLHYMK